MKMTRIKHKGRTFYIQVRPAHDDESKLVPQAVLEKIWQAEKWHGLASKLTEALADEAKYHGSDVSELTLEVLQEAYGAGLTAGDDQAQPAPGSTLDCTAVPVAEFRYVIDAPEVD